MSAKRKFYPADPLPVIVPDGRRGIPTRECHTTDLGWLYEVSFTKGTPELYRASDIKRVDGSEYRPWGGVL